MPPRSVSRSVHVEVLRRAAVILGGIAELRSRLRVSMTELDGWMRGYERPPAYIFLMAVDLMGEASSSAGDLRQLAADRRVWASLAERNAPLAVQRRELAVHDFAAAKFSPKEPEAVVEAALNAALSATAAVRGNIQLVCDQGLRIAAQLGFERPFLDFFAVVDDDKPSSCGRAHVDARRIVVPDVAADPIFAGTPAAPIMDDAGARAVQSTPLWGPSGQVIGMLSTHYERPHIPSPEELQAIDAIAERTSFWLNAELA